MLENDPPPGTRVRFVREVRKAKAYDTASLVRPVRKYDIDRPDDQFVVDYRGEQMTVERRDIEKIP